MKTTRSVRSLKSIRSMRSLRSGREDRKIEDVQQSFANLLVMTCAKFQCPYTIIVKKETQHDEFYKALMKQEGKGRVKRMSFISQVTDKTSNPASNTSVDNSSFGENPSVQVNSLIVTILYDHYKTLTEICIKDRKDVPNILLKIIRVLAPLYQNLTRITISKCDIDLSTIYELSKMLKGSTINSICLDGSPMPVGDFTMLLSTNHLTSLSLCRCNINDHGCELIASMLRCSAPADNLLLLNLSSNRITDVGAKYIAESLRTNRQLRYLNLSDNQIQDEGAGYIFDVLIEFPMTCDEIMGMKQRRLKYLKLRNDLYSKYLLECLNASADEISLVSRSSVMRRKKSKTIAKKEKDRLNNWANDEYIKTRAEMMTLDFLGHFRDPFQPDTVKFEDKYYYSLGNVTLQYLNLAFNNLSYISINKLCNVVKYQNTKKLGNRGLTKVVVDGNNLPITCIEMDTIKEILGRKIMLYSSKISEIVRHKTRN